VTSDQDSWTCSCGKKVPRAGVSQVSQPMLCPSCGIVIGVDPGSPESPSPADTQMINLSDMARMAQEGLDTAASGEWDTRDPERSGGRSDSDDG
jgi:hypothetical protein